MRRLEDHPVHDHVHDPAARQSQSAGKPKLFYHFSRTLVSVLIEAEATEQYHGVEGLRSVEGERRRNRRRVERIPCAQAVERSLSEQRAVMAGLSDQQGRDEMGAPPI